MKIALTLLMLICFCFVSNAQKLTEYKAINGITYKVGDTVRLGRGASPNGTFLYLQMGGWGAVLSYDSNAGPNQLNIGRGYANTAVVIKKIKTGKIKGIVKYYFTVGGGNITNYVLTIDDAIQVCEVVPCSSTDDTAVIQQSDDQFDKLKKLKGLLDSGAITQSEYDTQKAKLLNQ
ncbi:MAG: SHOCT domain-containing protein [Sphingobacteriales bacterium]